MNIMIRIKSHSISTAGKVKSNCCNICYHLQYISVVFLCKAKQVLSTVHYFCGVTKEMTDLLEYGTEIFLMKTDPLLKGRI